MQPTEHRDVLQATPSATRVEISFVLGTRDRLEFLRAAVQSIRADAVGVDYEIVVVDGGSVDGTRAWLESESDICLIRQEEQLPMDTSMRPSWGAFMNLGFRAAKFPYLFMISDDCLVRPGTVSACVDVLAGDLTNLGGIAVPWRNWPEDRVYRLGRTFGDLRFINHGIYARKALADVGWIDEDAYRFYHADGDLSIRIQRAGWTILDCRTAAVEHFMHANVALRRSNNHRQSADWDQYERRWGELGCARVDWESVTVPGGESDALPFQYWGRQRRVRALSKARGIVSSRVLGRKN
jgi:GT2 family glycosyltransferase